ncbi:TPA: hypothetical protein HA238_01335 [Candidatus Micrarchaeota archaeon]|nr:hypothetical protein [Candidatus Micrarchaeota archaeon]
MGKGEIPNRLLHEENSTFVDVLVEDPLAAWYVYVPVEAAEIVNDVEPLLPDMLCELGVIESPPVSSTMFAEVQLLAFE